MGFIDKTAKAIRLLISRRYTHNTLTDAQEAFASSIDIGVGDVYVDTPLIPSGSLPFSGSSQNHSTFTSGSQDVLKYWYRHKMTKSNVNNEVWFFLDPTGSDDGIGAQITHANQQTNFISPKYSAPALSNATVEDTDAGYNAIVYVSSAVSSSEQTSSLESGDKVSVNNFAFDYKTGVLQFSSSAYDPGGSDFVYLSTYQYVGRTLDSELFTLAQDSIFASTGSVHSAEGDLQMSGSVIISGSLRVEGQTVMDSLYSGSESLIVSGAMKIAKQEASNAIQSASVIIEGLGTFATPDRAGIIDLGDNFN